MYRSFFFNEVAALQSGTLHVCIYMKTIFLPGPQFA